MRTFRSVGLRAFLLSALVVLAGTVIGFAGETVPQDVSVLPQVVDASPARGEELPVDGAITLVFDRAMDQPSVEAAAVFSPDASGSWSWRDDRTATFSPDQGWIRNTAYTLTLSAQAADLSGLSLNQDFIFHFHSVGYLEVTQVVPAADSVDIATDTVILVMFNRPVVPLTALSDPSTPSLPDPISFEPAIDGSGEWLNTSIYAYTPNQPLAGGTQYRAVVRAGLTDTTGGILAEAVGWSFVTERPSVVWTQPGDGDTLVGVDASVSVEFNLPIALSSAKERFSVRKVGLFGLVTEPVQGVLALDGDSVIFRPAERLAFDQEYLVTLEPGVTAANGGLGTTEFTRFRFRTVPMPRILDTSPRNGAKNVDPYTAFLIRFNTPIDPDSVLAHVTIEPAPDPAEIYTYFRSWDNTYVLSFGPQPSRSYTVRIQPGITDPYGNSIDQSVAVHFETAPLEPTAWLHVPGDVSTFSSYEPARIVVAHRNTTQLDFTLTRIDIADYYDAVYDSYDFETPSRGKVRSWSLPVSSPLNEVAYASVDLLGGEPLEPGIYVVDLRAKGVDWNRWQHRHILVVSPVTLTLKTSADETLVWATDNDSGAPVPGLVLWALNGDGETVAVHVTDSRGIVQFPGSEETDWRGLTVMARTPFVLGSSSWDEGISTWEFGLYSESSPDARAYLDSDRPLYRAGQTVFFRGVVRAETDARYTLLGIEEVDVTITDSNWEVVDEQTLPLDEMGTFNGQFSLAADAALGSYRIQVRYADRTDSYGFQVAAYRVPEFEVSVSSPADEIGAGEAIDLDAAAAYYFGAPVKDVPVEWRVLSTPYVFAPDGFSQYAFDDNDDPWICWSCWWIPASSPVPVLEGSGRTDADGRLTISLPSDIATRSADAESQELAGSQRLTIEATAYGQDGQAISGRTSLVVHRGDFYVGLAADRSIGRAGEPMPIRTVTVNWAASRVAAQSLEYIVYRREWVNSFDESASSGGGRWTWTVSDVEVARGSLTTDDRGEGLLSFTPPEGGTYKVVVQGLDERARVVRSSLFVWVTGSEAVSWRRENNDRLTLISDRSSYRVGDVAEILVPSPYEGEQWALVTVERGGILSEQVVRLTSNSSVLEIPIDEDAVPNIYVSVVLIQGRQSALQTGGPATAGVKVGYVALSVDPSPRLLHVEVTPSNLSPLPGDSFRCDLRVTDAAGEPVEGVFSLDLVDKGVLALRPRTADRIIDTFYGERGLGVATANGLTVSLSRLVLEQMEDLAPIDGYGIADENAMAGAATPMAVSGAQPHEEAARSEPTSAAEQLPSGVDLREEFADTAYWNGEIVTDADGRASVDIPLPDNLTTWVIRAVGVTEDTEVGEASTDLLVTKPLLVRPVAPRFFVVGDHVQLAASVSNQTDEDRTVTVTLGSVGLTLESSPVQTVSLAAGSEAKLTWWVTVLDVEGVDLAFSAVSGDLTDAARPRLTTGPGGTIPVYRYTAPETVGTAGQLDEAGSRTEVLAIPEGIDPSQSRVDVRLDLSLAAAMQDGLHYLEHFEYECTEQVVSRFLPNVLTYRALQLLKLSDEELESRLEELSLEGLDKLYARQNGDGGWGWWDGQSSNPYLTAYAVYGLERLVEAGVTVRSAVLSQGLDYLRRNLVSSADLESAGEANRQAWLLFVLALGGRNATVATYATDLYAHRDKLSHYAEAYLALALHGVDPASTRIDTLLSDLANAAVLSATGAHWEEENYDWWAMNTDTRSTAVILDALVQLDPSNPLAANAVRWLMVARKGGIWETTQETAWALVALTDWMVERAELQANYAYGALWDSASLFDGVATPETVETSTTLEIDGSQLSSGLTDRLTVYRDEGEGTLYYTAHLNVQLPADQVEALDRGIVVYRQYVPIDCTDPVGCADLNQAAVGDTFEVRLTIVAPNDLYYVVLEDPIPAGCEIVDTSLATTSLTESSPSLVRDSDPLSPWYYWWWWRWYSRSEIRDEKVVLFADTLPAGTYSYRYTVRAVQPGDYRVLPTVAREFYFPEVFGRSDGRAFHVTASE